MRYIVKRKGKQLRPMFVLLICKTLRTRSMNPLTGRHLGRIIHTATLVHDDVVDESLERRGFFSVNALWKNKSFRFGWRLSSCKRVCCCLLNNNDFRILQIISDAVRKMSEGELLQIEKSRNLNLDEDIYYEIIKK